MEAENRLQLLLSLLRLPRRLLLCLRHLCLLLEAAGVDEAPPSEGEEVSLHRHPHQPRGAEAADCRHPCQQEETWHWHWHWHHML